MPSPQWYDGACNIGSIVGTARKTAILSSYEGGKHKQRDVITPRIHLANMCQSEQITFKSNIQMEVCEVKMSIANTWPSAASFARTTSTEQHEEYEKSAKTCRA